MKRSIQLAELSKHRTVLMGIAIVCVMLCHNTLLVPAPLVELRQILSNILQCGVDAFMLLSGLGLYYSFSRNANVGTFWKKRYTKILPPYIIVVVLYATVSVGLWKEATLLQYVWKYSLVSFFVDGKMALWFVAAILVLYAAFPLLYRLLQKYPRVFTIFCAAVVLSCIATPYFFREGIITLVNGVFVCRIPAFLVGMLIAKTVLDKKDKGISSVYVWLAWIISTVLIVYLFLMKPAQVLVFVRLLFLPFVLFGMLLLTQSIRKWKTEGILHKSLIFLGGLTLELYLIHERVISITDRLWMRWSHLQFSHVILAFLSNIVAIALAIGGAWLLQKSVTMLSGYFGKRKKD